MRAKSQAFRLTFASFFRFVILFPTRTASCSQIREYFIQINRQPCAEDALYHAVEQRSCPVRIVPAARNSRQARKQDTTPRQGKWDKLVWKLIDRSKHPPQAIKDSHKDRIVRFNILQDLLHASVHLPFHYMKGKGKEMPRICGIPFSAHSLIQISARISAPISLVDSTFSPLAAMSAVRWPAFSTFSTAFSIASASAIRPKE